MTFLIQTSRNELSKTEYIFLLIFNFYYLEIIKIRGFLSANLNCKQISDHIGCYKIIKDN
jgi:hypothetical protein